MNCDDYWALNITLSDVGIYVYSLIQNVKEISQIMKTGNSNTTVSFHEACFCSFPLLVSVVFNSTASLFKSCIQIVYKFCVTTNTIQFSPAIFREIMDPTHRSLTHPNPNPTSPSIKPPSAYIDTFDDRLPQLSSASYFIVKSLLYSLNIYKVYDRTYFTLYIYGTNSCTKLFFIWKSILYLPSYVRILTSLSLYVLLLRNFTIC